MLSELIEKFERLGTTLVQSVRRGDEAEIKLIDARLQPLTRRIFTYQARNYNEIMTQIEFFNRLVARNSEDDSSVRRYTAMVSELFARYRNAGDGVPHIPLADGYDPTLQEIILDSVPERVAVVGLDYRYIYCNQPNADFHNKRPADFIGKHMAEVIDADRFQSRAKLRMDQCFSGAKVTYNYEISDANGRMFEVDCRMTPLAAPDKSVTGAIIVLKMQPLFARMA